MRNLAHFWGSVQGGQSILALSRLTQVRLLIPRPYRQLAKVLNETGDQNGAKQVLFAMEDRRRQFLHKHSSARLIAFIPNLVLRFTIGYGLFPTWALLWLLFLALLRSFVIPVRLLGFCYDSNRQAMQEENGQPLSTAA